MSRVGPQRGPCDFVQIDGDGCMECVRCGVVLGDRDYIADFLAERPKCSIRWAKADRVRLREMFAAIEVRESDSRKSAASSLALSVDAKQAAAGERQETHRGEGGGFTVSYPRTARVLCKGCGVIITFQTEPGDNMRHFRMVQDHALDQHALEEFDALTFLDLDDAPLMLNG